MLTWLYVNRVSVFGISFEAVGLPVLQAQTEIRDRWYLLVGFSLLSVRILSDSNGTGCFLGGVDPFFLIILSPVGDVFVFPSISNCLVACYS